MGRGRSKAKQTKVARELKYQSPNIDLDRLRADLGVAPDHDFDGETDSVRGHSGWSDQDDDEENEARASFS
jgi:Protein of unknown function (DUF3073)